MWTFAKNNRAEVRGQKKWPRGRAFAHNRDTNSASGYKEVNKIVFATLNFDQAFPERKLSTEGKCGVTVCGSALCQTEACVTCFKK